MIKTKIILADPIALVQIVECGGVHIMFECGNEDPILLTGSVKNKDTWRFRGRDCADTDGTDFFEITREERFNLLENVLWDEFINIKTSEKLFCRYEFRDSHSLVVYDFLKMVVSDDDGSSDLYEDEGELLVCCGLGGSPVADYHGAQEAYDEYIKKDAPPPPQYLSTCIKCKSTWGNCQCETEVPEGEGFSFNGTGIVNPLLSECGRFFVDPIEHYGQAYLEWDAKRNAPKLSQKEQIKQNRSERIDTARNFLRDAGGKCGESFFSPEHDSIFEMWFVQGQRVMLEYTNDGFEFFVTPSSRNNVKDTLDETLNQLNKLNGVNNV